MTTLAAPPLKFTEADVERANAEWKANCGPAALAACLGWTLDAVRPHLGDFERKGYMNPRMMHLAIQSAGHRIESSANLPTHGLARVQWGGPWMSPGVPIGARYARTHWIATKEAQGARWVFDVNGLWRPYYAWVAEIVPAIVASIPKADGTFDFIDRWEVRRARP